MELLIEAISDLKSACSFAMMPYAPAPTDLATEGRLNLSRWKLFSVKVSIFVIRGGGWLPVILQRSAMSQTEAFRWSQNSLLMTSAPKELYSNPWAALADYPASILQRI